MAYAVSMPTKTNPERERRYRAVEQRLQAAIKSRSVLKITDACIAEGVSVQAYQGWLNRRRAGKTSEKGTP